VKDVEAAQVLLTKSMDDLTNAKEIVKSRCKYLTKDYILTSLVNDYRPGNYIVKER
jgi:hypothetical protein